MPKRANQEKKIAKHRVPNDVKEKQIDMVLSLMCDGKPTVTACDMAGIAAPSFHRWIQESPELLDRYARARDTLIERIADETLKISDEPVGTLVSGGMDSAAVAKQRLQVDTRKWLLSKLSPKRYGDKLELSGDAENPMETVTRIEIVSISADKAPGKDS